VPRATNGDRRSKPRCATEDNSASEARMGLPDEALGEQGVCRRSFGAMADRLGETMS
jgi:hypothetical protein